MVSQVSEASGRGGLEVDTAAQRGKQRIRY